MLLPVDWLVLPAKKNDPAPLLNDPVALSISVLSFNGESTAV
jgi:hypothetical protein